MRNKWVLATFVGMAVIGLMRCGTAPVAQPPATPFDPSQVKPSVSSRPYYMGFTRWPPDFEIPAIDGMYRFIGDHADLLAHHFDGGIPWQEALEGKPLPDHLLNDWQFSKSRTPRGHAVYVSITPLDLGRDKLALKWGKKDNMPLEAPWKDYPINHPNVKKAYYNYAEKVIEYFEPRFLAIGIESNIAVSKNPEVWAQYLDLHREVYRRLKAAHPNLVIFASVQLEHLKGTTDDSKGKQAQQEAAVRDLLQYCDLLGLSTYPYAFWNDQRPVPRDYLDVAYKFGKTVAIAETGYSSNDVSAFGMKWPATEDDQLQWFQLLLAEAARHRYPFVINYVAIDYNRLQQKIPWGFMREFSNLWVYTGMQAADGRKKRAMYVWAAYFKLPRSGSRATAGSR